MTAEEESTIIGRNTRITVAAALGFLALSMGAITSYMQFKDAVRTEIRNSSEDMRKEIREFSVETAVELTKLNVQMSGMSANVKDLSDSMQGSEARSEARYEALRERIRVLEQAR